MHREDQAEAGPSFASPTCKTRIVSQSNAVLALYPMGSGAPPSKNGRVGISVAETLVLGTKADSQIHPGW